MTEPIRVLVADNHPVTLLGMRAALAAEADMHVVGEAKDGETTCRLCKQLNPDILLLDLHMPGLSPVETMTCLREHCPDVKVLVLTAYDDSTDIRRALAAGVAGYMLKDERRATVVMAIRAVMQGRSWFSQSITQQIQQWMSDQPSQSKQLPLTDEEQHLLHMIAAGWTNARIADELKVQPQTVRNYVSHLYCNLGVHSRVEAMIWIREHGLTGG